VASREQPERSLIEHDLCECYSVSWLVVWQTTRVRESEGLVAVGSRMGPIVATVSTSVGCLIYVVRAALDGLARRLFAKRVGDASMADLVAASDPVARRDPGAIWRACLDQPRFTAATAEAELAALGIDDEHTVCLGSSVTASDFSRKSER